VLSSRRGRIVAFLGPDGAGKSTVIDLVQKDLAELKQDYRYVYFAPGYLKRYRPNAASSITTNPQGGRQYSSPFVLAKIGLLLFEFRMGIPKLRREVDLVLFDRFIHDLLVDPRRYRLNSLRFWMKAMLRLAPKPDLVFVICAPTETIQARKQEVTPEETTRQISAYKALASSMSNALVVYNTDVPEEAAKIVLAEIKKLM
tara:strand:- start:3206 stop:3808 length:603 start_codon:yes stop_codon:yes gene_type:complete